MQVCRYNLVLLSYWSWKNWDGFCLENNKQGSHFSYPASWEEMFQVLNNCCNPWVCQHTMICSLFRFSSQRVSIRAIWDCLESVNEFTRMCSVDVDPWLNDYILFGVRVPTTDFTTLHMKSIYHLSIFGIHDNHVLSVNLWLMLIRRYKNA